MGVRTQAAEETHEGNVGTGRTHDPDLRQGKPGRRPQPAPTALDAAAALRHAQSLFPEFIGWLKAVRDPRKCPGQATFAGEYLLLLVLMMFCTMSGSRRKFAKAMGGGPLCANVWRMAGRELADVCHTDTMNLFMEGVEPEELEMLIVKIVGRIRLRKLLHRYGFRRNAWKNYYLILQVSQLFHDFLRYTDIIQTLGEDVRSTLARLYGSMRCFVARLLESLRGKLLSFDPLWRGRHVQIRFSTA